MVISIILSLILQKAYFNMLYGAGKEGAGRSALVSWELRPGLGLQRRENSRADPQSPPRAEHRARHTEGAPANARGERLLAAENSAVRGSLVCRIPLAP